jgi:hypothetical protein
MPCFDTLRDSGYQGAMSLEYVHQDYMDTRYDDVITETILTIVQEIPRNALAKIDRNLLVTVTSESSQRVMDLLPATASWAWDKRAVDTDACCGNSIASAWKMGNFYVQFARALEQGLDGEQNVGIATTNGAIRLPQASYPFHTSSFRKYRIDIDGGLWGHPRLIARCSPNLGICALEWQDRPENIGTAVSRFVGEGRFMQTRKLGRKAGTRSVRLRCVGINAG